MTEIPEIDENVEYYEEDGDEEDHDEMIVMKWIIDGTKTLEEAAKGVHAFAEYLQSLHDDGNVLRAPIDNGMGFYYKNESE